MNEEGVLLVPEGIESIIQDRGFIKLKEFSKVFFPMFVAYFSGEQVDLRAWFYATKTKGTLPVDVIDGKDIAFTVPAIISADRDEFGKGLQKDPADIMALAQIKDREAPGAGNRYIQANLIEGIEYDEYDEVAQRKFMEDWVKIFNYYGYEATNLPQSKKLTKSGEEKETAEFDYYDEL